MESITLEQLEDIDFDTLLPFSLDEMTESEIYAELIDDEYERAVVRGLIYGRAAL